MEADLVARHHIPFTAIPAAGIHGVGLRTLPGNIIRLIRGTAASRRILRDFHPDVLLFTGGYVAVPMALAAYAKKSLLYVPDIEPGLALKVLAYFADCVAVSVPESRAYFSRNKHVEVTGYPVRSDLTRWTRSESRSVMNLSEDLPVLLVYGGSKGARSINRALIACLPEILTHTQVIHISGQLDWSEVQAAYERLTPDLASRYHPYPYLHDEMGAALAAADLVICRAGASTLGELPLFALPAILVPYPHAWRYQKVNAEYLAQSGGAILVEDEQLSQQMLPLVLELLQDPLKLEKMRGSMRQLLRSNAENKIADLLRGLASDTLAEGRNTSW